jgi:hypothetical protein
LTEPYGGFDERAGCRAAVAIAMPDQAQHSRGDHVPKRQSDNRRVARVHGKSRNDGHAQSGADHALDGAVVVGSEDDTWFHTVPADELFQLR